MVAVIPRIFLRLQLVLIAPVVLDGAAASSTTPPGSVAEHVAAPGAVSRRLRGLWGGLNHIVSLFAPPDTNCAAHPETANCVLYRMCGTPTYCIISGYMVVPGAAVAGMETINGTNAASFDTLMDTARSRCDDPVICVLITNPVGFRTQDQLHIHYQHFNPVGAHLKMTLEQSLCNSTSATWQPVNQPYKQCGNARARLYDAWPRVFSEVALAEGGGSLAHVGITVWTTTACDGIKTMILLTYSCSIEHNIVDR